jgi:hypothetical protein
MSIGSVSDKKGRQPDVILQHLSQRNPEAILLYYSIGKSVLLLAFFLPYALIMVNYWPFATLVNKSRIN